MKLRRPRSIGFSSLASLLMVLPVLAVGSCSPAPNAGDVPPSTTTTTTETASSGPAPMTTHPAVVLPDGFAVTLELAITPDELAQGLMYRPQLPDDRGMLLLFSEERLPNIWMMNTLVALDIVYLDNAGVVVDVITDAQPCPAEPCPRFTPKQPARAVLEIPAGGVSRHGVTEGAKLEILDVPDFPVID